jgi:phosphoglycerate dehydrogenase-like enzyme
MMNIGFFMPKNSVWNEGIASLKAEYPQHGVFPAFDPESPDVDILDIIVTGRLPMETLLRARNLQAVFQPITGVNHLPLKELRDKGVKVFNVHSNAFDVAEHALAMTLAFYGRIVQYHNDLKTGLWHGMWVRGGAEDNLESIFGKSCTILGTGAIGSELARLFKAFSCTVHGWHRRNEALVPPCFDDTIEDMREAIRESEIIAVTLPATKLTDGLLTKEILLGMNGKFLVNVGRGSIIDEEGLFLALHDKVLKGAAIDTWYSYPPSGKSGFPSRFPFQDLPNVIMSPHVAGSTSQAVSRSVRDTMKNLREYLDSGSSGNEVDLSAMY